MRAPAAVLALSLALPAGGAPDAALEARREAIARELLRVAAALRGEVERGDAAAILARVPDAGLSCGERRIPKARLARDLASRESWLHGILFGGPGYVPPPGTAPSLRALLRAHDEVATAVSFVRDPRAGPLGRPCVAFRVEGVGSPDVPICFEERGGRWWIVESLYPCG